VASGPLKINDRVIATGDDPYIVAEMSGNHNGDFDRAKTIVEAAAAAGADAIKVQTYTADTLTLDIREEPFIVDEPMWKGQVLHDLFSAAAMPWEWQPMLKMHAEKLGLDFFSTPFDVTATDFLEELGVPVYKIASSELVDIQLIRYVASKRRPMIISTGMGTKSEIDAALHAATDAGADGVVLLRCNASYPAPLEEMDLQTIDDMIKTWGVPVGFSDHSLGNAASVTAVALGACLVEKHLTLSREDGGADAGFSLEPSEFTELTRQCRDAYRSKGQVRYGPSEHEIPTLAGRRSLFVIKDIALGELLSSDNVRSIRPANGLPPSCLHDVIGMRARRTILRGTPLSWELIEP